MRSGVISRDVDILGSGLVEATVFDLKGDKEKAEPVPQKVVCG